MPQGDIEQDDSQIAVPLGARVRHLREEAGLTLEKPATAAGVSRATPSKMERGEKSPTINAVSRVAKGTRPGGHDPTSPSTPLSAGGGPPSCW